MSRVSYFQRFSQPENHATNNTLLVLRYFYQSSPFKLQRLLTSLLEVDMSIGLSFEQQIQGEASVPDALISQEPLRIFVETKRYGKLDTVQIRNHCESIAKDGRHRGDVLIGLSKELVGEADRKAMLAEAAARGIIFVNITFSQIVEALKAQCADFERELLAIVEDYETYLTEEGLLDDRNRYLLIFPCGTSIAENAKFAIYYEPPARRLKKGYRYIGVYNKKTVAYVGVVQAIAVAAFAENGTVSFTEEMGRLTDEQKERVKATVTATPYYELAANPHRYYLVDEFAPTSARKVSSGGIMGHRYLELSKLAGSYNPKQDYTSAELAAILALAIWE